MGIPVHCTFTGLSQAEAAERIQKVEKIFRKYDERFSRFKETSELMKLNNSNGVPHKVSLELFQVIKKCVALSEETGGVFDLSVGGILASYGYGLPKNFAPIIPFPTYRDISFNDRNLEITLVPGQILEPANIVKGIAIDAAGSELKGVPGFMINAGGDILTKGAWGGEAAWNIAIEDPRDSRAIVATVGIQDRGLATSGVYQTCGEHGGRPWHHLIDYTTFESTRGITSATVIAPTCEQADQEASIAILLGVHKGIARLERLGLPFFIILDDGTIRKNAAFAALEIPIETIVR